MIHNRAKELAVWRATIALKAKEAGCKPVEGPVRVNLIFHLKRPKTVKRLFPIVAPDLDKLIRGVLDGLTGVAYVDDAQVVDIFAQKVYTNFAHLDVEISTPDASNSVDTGVLFE